MAKCLKCNNEIPISISVKHTWWSPIECPHCKNKVFLNKKHFTIYGILWILYGLFISPLLYHIIGIMAYPLMLLLLFVSLWFYWKFTTADTK